MLTRRVQILQSLTRRCIPKPTTPTRFVSSNSNGPSPSYARNRRARFITREIRHEEPISPPRSKIIEPQDEPPSPGPLPLSLYEALFRKPTPSPIEDAIEHTTPTPTYERPPPPSTTTTTTETYDEEPPLINLRGDDELSGWLNEALVKALRSTPPTETNPSNNPPSVLVLSPLPRSLLPSDFYRLAPQGTQIDGWAKGLQKVIQARHPHTHEPREQYFLIFDTRSSAQAYLDNIQTLHAQSLEALHPAFHPPTPPNKKPLSNTKTFYADDYGPGDPFPEDPFLDDPDNTVSLFPSRNQLLSYALLPPTTPLSATMIRLDSLLAQIHQKTLKHPGLVPYAMQRHLTPNHKNPPHPDDNRVLIRLQGGRATKEHLHYLINQDGRERNLEWDLELFEDEIGGSSGSEPSKRKVKRDWNTIHPLKISQKMVKSQKTEKEREMEELEGPRDDEDQEEEEEEGGVAGYRRYIVSFRTATEAKRFVRAWHQRGVGDGRSDRVLKVHCTGLW